MAAAKMKTNQSIKKPSLTQIASSDYDSSEAAEQQSQQPAQESSTESQASSSEYEPDSHEIEDAKKESLWHKPFLTIR